MIDKDTVRDLMLKECDICVHLHGKIPEGTLDFRLSPGQRSTLELLRYLGYCGITGVRVAAEDTWGVWKEGVDATADMEAADFPAVMERQKEAIRAYLDDLSEEDIAARTFTSPLGESMPLAHALVELPLHWLVAYRMQLFLHAKAAGNEEIWTPDCWAGIDMERPGQGAG